MGLNLQSVWGEPLDDLSWDAVCAYRARTFRWLPELQLSSRDQAVDFVNERGFVMFWPIKDILMPSLWGAVAGDRRVADEHDDPGHVTWGWKDGLLGSRVWYYAKVIRKKATMISLDLIPYFYALSENFGAPEEDYIEQYRQGTLTLEAKLIYEALLKDGPMHSVALRSAVSMTDNAAKARFNRGLDDLQADLKILPVGVAEAGAWNYAFIYECVHRHYPDLPARAGRIGISEAHRKLLEVYLASVGAAQLRDLLKVFQWLRADVERALQALMEAEACRGGVQIEGQAGEWIAAISLW